MNKNPAFTNQKSKTFLLALFFVVGFISFTGSAQAEGPAVSAVNAKVEGFGGSVDGAGSGGGAASVALPLPKLKNFGIQFDALGGEFNNLETAAGGVHMFWRDPEKGLLGATYNYTDFDIGDMHRAGGEGEYYWGDFTFAANGGWQGSDDIPDAGYGGASFSAYITEYFMLQAGFQHAWDTSLGYIEAEWQPDLEVAPGLSVFANFAGAENDYEHALAGVRYYFGAKKSLMKRHREDDPSNNLFVGSTVVGQALRRANEAKKDREIQSALAQVKDANGNINAGTFETGANTVTVSKGSGPTVVTITNTTTGEVTIITIPTS